MKGGDARCLKRQGEVGSCRPLDELVLYGVDHAGRVFSREGCIKPDIRFLVLPPDIWKTHDKDHIHSGRS